MDLFEFGRFLHSMAGTVALIAFWIAAWGEREAICIGGAGKFTWRRSSGHDALVADGRGNAVQGDPGAAVFLGFLISLVGTASWLMWFSIRYKQDEVRFHGLIYRALARGSWSPAPDCSLSVSFAAFR